MNTTVDTDFEKQQPWRQRWLTGVEYFEMLTNIHHYASTYNFPILNDHPISIYYQPQNGFIYYLRKQTLRKLGFPRLNDNQKKVYKWKKMNFQTLLPKSRPRVVYIVCSTTSTEDSYRMHIVQLATKESAPVLLCHLLQMEPRAEIPTVQPDDELRDAIRRQDQELRNLIERYVNLVTPFEIALPVDNDRAYVQQRRDVVMEVEPERDTRYSYILERATNILQFTQDL